MWHLLFLLHLLLSSSEVASDRKSNVYYLDSHQCRSPLSRNTDSQGQEEMFDGAVVYSHAAAPRVFSLVHQNLSYARQVNRTISNDPTHPSSQNAIERRLLEDFERLASHVRSQSPDLQFPHNLDCQLTLRAPQSKKIMFYFDYLDIRDASMSNDCNDALYVFAHPNVYAAALEQAGGNSGLCGSTVLRRVFSTTASYLTLNFRTNDRLPNGLGFRVVVTAFTEADPSGSCGASHQCGNGWCIDPSLRCNGVDNCGDGHDEQQCNAEESEPETFLGRFMQLGVSASLVIAIGSILILVLAVGTLVCLCTRKRPQAKACEATEGLSRQSAASLASGSPRSRVRTPVCPTPGSVHSAPFFYPVSVVDASSSVAASATPSLARTAPVSCGRPMQPSHAYQPAGANVSIPASAFSSARDAQYFHYCASSRKRPRQRAQGPGLGPGPGAPNTYFTGLQVQPTFVGMQAAAFVSTPNSSRSAQSRSAFSHCSSFAPQNVRLISNPVYNQPSAYSQSTVIPLGYGPMVQELGKVKCTTDTDATSSSFSRQVERMDASSSTDEDDYAAHDDMLGEDRNMEMSNVSLGAYLKANYGQTVFNQFVNSNVDTHA